jgi:hypothetical protein
VTTTPAGPGEATSASEPPRSASIVVANVYGHRNFSRGGIWDLMLNVELPETGAGAFPFSIMGIVLDAPNLSTRYVYTATHMPEGAPASTAYSATWIRGAADGYLKRGDLVELHLNVDGPEPVPGTPVSLSLGPYGSFPTRVEFTTPTSYGTDQTITLAGPTSGHQPVPSPGVDKIRVTNIYGIRNDTSSNLWDFQVILELPRDAESVNLSTALLRASRSPQGPVADYPFSLHDFSYGGPTHPTFSVTWLRAPPGEPMQPRDELQPGDTVSLHFNDPSGTLATRAPMEITLIFSSQSAISATFTTPSTYGTDTSIALW